MATATLLTPTLHIEIHLLKSSGSPIDAHQATRKAAAEWIQENYATVTFGKLAGYQDTKHLEHVGSIDIADFTGPLEPTGYYSLADTVLDCQTYVLHSESDSGIRRSIKRDSDPQSARSRVIALPNIALNEDWDSLVFEDGLPSRLLRYLVRMVGMMGKPGLNLATFNWNKLCLLHGPPGSGKSTLCRALAQKLSIRLGDQFSKAVLVQVNANALFSKFFGESGKLIENTFHEVQGLAKDHARLVIVVIDEVETIVSSRQRGTAGNECIDGLRATNQLLTALDRVRSFPNILVCCTSNLIEAIDPAFLDRVDIKQYIPCPSKAAVYNIFRGCLNELVRSELLSVNDIEDVPHINGTLTSSPPPSAPRTQQSSPTRKRRHTVMTRTPPQTKEFAHIPASSMIQGDQCHEQDHEIPTLASALMAQRQNPLSPGQRIWELAQKCEGLCLSGRTLRRLPMLGLAMHTWGGRIRMTEAIGALEKAVGEELIAMSNRKAETEDPNA
ncbi:hypothetical protein WHR41_02782 [Cladosporium halotolerans]|uniref:AAA+ ATPase domain-containing protein n=1 Tax=Cladosporium halotolerans TaxID=1052096 RepID=A0AB34KWC6_9PEZI